MKLLNNNNIFIVLFISLILVKFVGAVYSISLYPITTILIIFLFSSQNFILSNLKKYWIFLLLFGSYAIITLLWTSAPNYGLRKIYLILPLLVIGILSANIFKENRLKFLKFSGIFFFGVLLILIFVDFDKIIENSLYSTNRYRIDEQVNSNTIAVFFGIGTIISLYNYKVLKGISRFFLLFSTIAFIGFSVFNGSRGNLISIIFSIVLVEILYASNNNKAYLKYLTFIIVFLLVIINTGFFKNLIEHNYFISSRFLSEESYVSLDERFLSYRLVLSNIDLKIFLGNGIGDFGNLLTGTDTTAYPHNIFLEILYELGFIIFSVFLTILFLLHRKCIRLRKINKVSNDILFIINLVIYFLLFAQSSGDITDNFLLFIFLIYLHNILNEHKHVKT